MSGQQENYSEDLGSLGFSAERSKPASESSKPAPQKRKQIEYYAEESFQGARLGRSVHLGWGALIGGGIIFFCMGMSAFTQGQSWNVSARWLQRRVGAQFGTMAYIITSNAMYYHDGDQWQVRDWANLGKRLNGWTAAAASPPASADSTSATSLSMGSFSRGFAADAARP